MKNDSKGLGDVEVYLTDDTYFRDEKDWKDQNEISGHPSAALSILAYRNWHHRKLAVPTSKIGSTAKDWNLVAEINTNSSTYVINYDNIVITSGNKTVKTIYEDGIPSANTSRGGTGYICSGEVVKAISRDTPQPVPTSGGKIKTDLTVKVGDSVLTALLISLLKNGFFKAKNISGIKFGILQLITKTILFL